ncbi:MAG TPA: hypothetical protein VGR37_11295 [Longimicrobiaceae bacterium]|nr:hypothetical protein [Longimicrobiaceae bacterium]
MSRTVTYIAALAAGLALSACADRPADKVAPAPRTAQAVPALLCGDASRPCELDAVVVSSPRAPAAENTAVSARS